MKQLIIVNVKEKNLYLKEFNKKWETKKIIRNICLGKNGASQNKMEGDLKTPLGLFKLGPAFGTKNLKIKYPYIKITENSYWIDDINSRFYNKWVELNGKNNTNYSYIINDDKVTWKTSEHLIDYNEYELGLIIEYNIINPNHKKGSAIFLHIKNKNYTKGCISLDKKDLRYILNWLDWEKNPHILIQT